MILMMMMLLLLPLLLPFAWINPLKGCLGMSQAIFVISFEWEWELPTKTEMKMRCTPRWLLNTFLIYPEWPRPTSTAALWLRLWVLCVGFIPWILMQRRRICKREPKLGLISRRGAFKIELIVLSLWIYLETCHYVIVICVLSKHSPCAIITLHTLPLCR